MKAVNKGKGACPGPRRTRLMGAVSCNVPSQSPQVRVVETKDQHMINRGDVQTS